MNRRGFLVQLLALAGIAAVAPEVVAEPVSMGLDLAKGEDFTAKWIEIPEPTDEEIERIRKRFEERWSQNAVSLNEIRTLRARVTYSKPPVEIKFW